MNSYYLNNDRSDPQESMLPLSAMYEDADGGREFDLRTLHLSDGVIFIKGEINSAMAVKFASAMLYLSKEGQKARIYINSGGGEVNAGLMMYDIIQSFDGEIEMYCIGMAASMAAVLLAGGRKGKRFILPHSQVMIHEPLISGGFGGSASTIERTAKAILDVRDVTNGLIAKHTSHTLEEINKATEQDNFMNAEQAVEFGICDAIKGLF